ncbi:MAG: recombinase family protein [Clostridiaceae bacterium]|nr:recombinase family protein [Clostridiaceae bacterium]
MEKVAIYCRLSDEDRDKISRLQESESIQNQKNLLMKYATEQKWDIYKIYSDDDYSGLDKDRPEFSQMLKDAQEKKFQIILCKHQSRFSRDMELIEKYLHKKFPEWGIRFISVTDYIDTLDKGNKKSRQIHGLINEWYCEDISEAIRATFKIKREEGKFIGSFAPYGYKKSIQNKSKLVIDEEAATVIKMIFDCYLQGYGTQHIAYMLNEKGIPNPTQYKRNKGLKFQNSSQTDGYGLWNKTTIRRILRNEIYMGNMVQGKGEKINYKSKKVLTKSQEDWVVVEGTHKPIIDIDTFHTVQERLNSKVRTTKQGKAHLFATKLRCMDCGSTMNKVRAGKGREYLRCKLYARDPKKQLCTSHSIRLDLLQNMVEEKIKNHIKRINDNDLVYKLKKEDHFLQKQMDINNEIKNLEKRIEEKNRIIKNLYIDKVKELIPIEQFSQLNHDFISEKASLQERLKKMQQQVEGTKEKSKTVDRWFDTVRKYKNFKELSHMMVNELIEHIEIGEKDQETVEQKIIIHWKF